MKAQELGVQGRVYVSFVVAKDGSVKDAKIARGVHETIDEEAIRVIKSMPMWEPGMKQGEFVNVSFTVPINFVFDGESKTESIVGSDKQPLLIVDGNEINYSELEKN